VAETGEKLSFHIRDLWKPCRNTEVHISRETCNNLDKPKEGILG